MQITEFRQKYPEYDDMSDVDLTRKLHAKNYSDVDYDVFANRFGLTAPKGIGFVESAKEEFARPAKGAQYVPGLGGIVGAAEQLSYLAAGQRLQKGYDYSKPVQPEQLVPGAMGIKPARYANKEADVKLVEDLILRTQEQQERGYTYGGKVVKGILNLPTWMAEFAMTGGLASLGSGAARTAGTKLMGQWAKTKAGRIALRGAGWTGGAITRATLGLTPRVAEKALGRQVKVQILGAEKEGWATSFAKAWGDITIEAASETAGEALTGIPIKLLSKTKFGSKFINGLRKGWMKTTGGTAGDFAKKILRKGGYSNIIGEYGEERLGTLLRALTAVEDFGVGKDAGVIERLKAATKQDLDPTNIAVEFTVLGVVPGAQVMLGVAEQLRTKRVSKLVPGDIDNLIYAGTSSISDAVAKHTDMPGVNIIAEHLVRRYGSKKGSTFYDRKIERLADGGKKISNYWNEQANKGWQAPNSDATEAKWKDKPTNKTVSAVYSGLTSAGTVIGTTFLTEGPHSELMSLANSEADIVYNRLKSEGVSDNVATKFAQIAGAWTYATQEIPFNKLLGSNKASILAALKKSEWKGVQEVTETIGHNLLEYFGYKYTRPQNIPTAVKAAYDHAMDGWLNALVGGLGIGRAAPPTVEQLTGKTLSKIEPQTPDQVTGAKHDLTPEQTDRRLQQATFRYRELKRVPTISEFELTTHEKEELAFLEKNRTNIEAILKRDIASKAEKIRGRSKLPTRPAPPPIKAQMSIGRLKALARKLRKRAKLSDTEFSDLADSTTDKLSMEDMNKKQLINFVSALEEGYSTYGRLAQEDYHKEVEVVAEEEKDVVVGTRIAYPMSVVYNEALESIRNLKSKKEADAIIKKPTAVKTPITKAWKWTKSFAIGIKNTPVFHLARRLDSEGSNIFSRVLDKGIEHGRKKAARFKRIITEAVVKLLKDHKVTGVDLAKMGRSVNPGLISELFKKVPATKVFDIKIKGTLESKSMGEVKRESREKTYQMTMADLIDVYLMSKQDDGIRHLKGGGLIINGTRTGKLSQEQINILTQMAEDDPKAKAVIKIIPEVVKIWKKEMNSTSQWLDDKDVATVKDWWGLEVYMPAKKKDPDKPVTVEETLAEMKIADIDIGRKQKIDLIENQSILHDRTKDTAPLIVRDAFNRLNVFSNAIAEYVGMAGPTRTARTLINDPDVVAMLKEKGYDDVRAAIAKIHKRAEDVPASAGEFTAWFAEHLPNLYRAVLYLNTRVILSQKTSLFNYGAYVSPEFMNVAEFLTVDFKWSDMQETMELSDIAWDRFHMAHSSLELGEIARSDATYRMWTGGKASDKNKMGWTLKITDLSALTDGIKIAQKEYKVLKRDGKLTGLSEEWWRDKDPTTPWIPDADIELWRKVKEREKTITAENPLTEEEHRESIDAKNWQRVISDRAEYLWQRSQPSWDKWNRSLLTSEKGARQLFILFRSFHEKSLTIFNEIVLDYQNSAKTLDDKGEALKRIAPVITGYTFNAFLRAVVMTAITAPVAMIAGRKIWPDEKRQHKIYQDLIMSWFAMSPIFGNLVKATISRIWDVKAGVKTSYTYAPIGSLPVDVVNDLLKSSVDFGDAIGHQWAGENEKAEEAFIRGMKRLGKGVGMLSGFPITELKRIFVPKKEPKPKKKVAKW